MSDFDDALEITGGVGVLDRPTNELEQQEDSLETAIDGVCSECGVACNGDHGEQLDHGHEHESDHCDHPPGCEHRINEKNAENHNHVKHVDLGESEKPNGIDTAHSHEAEHEKHHHDHEHGPDCQHCIDEANHESEHHHSHTDHRHEHNHDEHGHNAEHNHHTHETATHEHEHGPDCQHCIDEANQHNEEFTNLADTGEGSVELAIDAEINAQLEAQAAEEAARQAESERRQQQTEKTQELVDDEAALQYQVAATEAGQPDYVADTDPETSQSSSDVPTPTEEPSFDSSSNIENIELQAAVESGARSVDREEPLADTVDGLAAQIDKILEGSTNASEYMESLAALDGDSTLTETAQPTTESPGSVGAWIEDIENVFEAPDSETMLEAAFADLTNGTETSFDGYFETEASLDEGNVTTEQLETTTQTSAENTAEGQTDLIQIEISETASTEEAAEAFSDFIERQILPTAEGGSINKAELVQFIRTIEALQDTDISDQEKITQVIGELVKLYEEAGLDKSAQTIRHYSYLFGYSFVVQVLRDLKEIEQRTYIEQAPHSVILKADDKADDPTNTVGKTITKLLVRLKPSFALR